MYITKATLDIFLFGNIFIKGQIEKIQQIQICIVTVTLGKNNKKCKFIARCFDGKGKEINKCKSVIEKNNSYLFKPKQFYEIIFNCVLIIC